MRRLTFLLGCFLLLGAIPARPVTPDHTAASAAGMNSSPADPIRVTPLTSRTGQSRPGRGAADPGAWVNEPVLQVENVSGKAIKYLVVEASFPGAGGADAPLPLMLGYGRLPGQEPVRAAEAPLLPGAKINLTVSRHACGGVAPRLLAESPQPPSASHTATRINVVVFADGTAWFAGSLNVRDRRDPLRWHAAGASPSLAAWAPAPLFKLAKAGYGARPAPAPAQDSECGDQAGFVMMDCCEGFYVATATIIPNPAGRFELLPTRYTCSDGSYCYYDQRVPCSSQ